MTLLETNENEYENKISKTIKFSSIDLYVLSGYKSIMVKMIKISGKLEKNITYYELFAELISVFGRSSHSKIFDPIKFKIDKVRMINQTIIVKKLEKININQEKKMSLKN